MTPFPPAVFIIGVNRIIFTNEGGVIALFKNTLPCVNVVLHCVDLSVIQFVLVLHVKTLQISLTLGTHPTSQILHALLHSLDPHSCYDRGLHNGTGGVG